MGSLNVETETETKFTKVSISRLRPRLNLQPIFTYIYLYLPIFTTYIYLYLPIFTTYILRFSLCLDRDSSRLLNSVVVETETHRDWEFLWLSRPRLIETGSFCGCRDRDQPRLNKSCRDRDFIESLADLWPEQFEVMLQRFIQRKVVSPKSYFTVRDLPDKATFCI